MMDRLTKWKHGFAYLKTTELHDPCEWCFEATQKLAHYEDLEEAGRIIILPKGYNNEKFKEENCPSTLGLKECCYESADCDECWEAALKERESE